MTLPISDVVRVDISVAPTAVPLAGFGEVLFLTDEVGVISTTERLRKYKSLAAVQGDWAANTEVSKAATAFYAQTPTPTDFTVGLVSESAFAGSLIGGSHATIEELKAVTGGGFSITIDSVAYNPTGIDLSSATTLEEVASLLQTALAGELAGTTCIYLGGRFQVGSPTTGITSTVSYVTSDVEGLGQMLGLRQANLGVISDGGDPENPVSALPKIVELSSSFVAVSLNKKYRDTAIVLDVSDWCEGSKKIFLNVTNDVATQSLVTAPSTFAGQLKAKAPRLTSMSYAPDEDQYPGMSLFGRIATVNYEGTNTAITLKFKRLPTITVANITTSQKAALDSINVGAFLDFGVSLFYAESRMADGGWFDAVHALLWLENRIQVGVFNRMQTLNKVAYTDAQVGIVIQEVVAALQQGVTNGFLAPGNDASGTYLPLGYEVTAIPVANVSQADKSNRIYRGITFKAVGAGALHNVVISGNFNE